MNWFTSSNDALYHASSCNVTIIAIKLRSIIEAGGVKGVVGATS